MTLNRDATYTKVVQLVAHKLNVDRERVERATSFQDLGADSLDMVEIVMKLEEEFDVEINDDDAEKMTSINQVVDYIIQRARRSH